jgi:TRAP-type mannitol/chloroaromatic compound transport system permease large subunit
MSKMIQKSKKIIAIAFLNAMYVTSCYAAGTTNNGTFSNSALGNSTNNFDAMATKASGAIDTSVNLAVAFFGIAGLFLVGNSLLNLYKSSKDPSHQVKPMSGVIGLIIGGLLLAVGVVAASMRNSIVGA